jgi:hypothetical protein
LRRQTTPPSVQGQAVALIWGPRLSPLPFHTSTIHSSHTKSNSCFPILSLLQRSSTTPLLLVFRRPLHIVPRGVPLSVVEGGLVKQVAEVVQVRVLPAIQVTVCDRRNEVHVLGCVCAHLRLCACVHVCCMQGVLLRHLQGRPKSFTGTHTPTVPTLFQWQQPHRRSNTAQARIHSLLSSNSYFLCIVPDFFVPALVGGWGFPDALSNMLLAHQLY